MNYLFGSEKKNNHLDYTDEQGLGDKTRPKEDKVRINVKFDPFDTRIKVPLDLASFMTTTMLQRKKGKDGAPPRWECIGDR